MDSIVASKNTARIIVSYLGMPSSLMGSWTQLIEYHLNTFNHNEIDYLLCGPTNLAFNNTTTKTVICKSLNREINRDWFQPFKFISYVKALETIIPQHEFVVITIMDNTKLKNIVSHTIAKNGWQHKCKVIFVQCGFSYEFTRDEYKDFRTGLDEIILLTEKSYQYERNKYHEYTFLTHILYNPVRHDIFFKVNADKKRQLKAEIGIADDTKFFLWVGHDRPKKGLNIILRMWPQVVAKYPNSTLIVVGVKSTISLPGLRFEGKIPNASIAKYYQSCDVFLFSSLCQEGFSLSLVEAMSCGCFCIASDSGGNAEYFAPKDGIIVTRPNQVAAWEQAIDTYYQLDEPQKTITNITKFMSYDEWCTQFQAIMNNSLKFLTICIIKNIVFTFKFLIIGLIINNYRKIIAN
jgi:L-malate glycosyltransferase